MYRWIPYQHEVQYVNQWHFSNENKMLQHHSVSFLSVVKLFLTEIPVLAVGLICMKTCNLNSETQSVCYAMPHLNLERKKDVAFMCKGWAVSLLGVVNVLCLCWSVVSNFFLKTFWKLGHKLTDLERRQLLATAASLYVAEQLRSQRFLGTPR